MDDADRAERLAEHLIAPLVVGGSLVPQRPFGLKLGLELGVERSIVDSELSFTIEQARLRRARAIVALDLLPPLSPAEWAMAAALNDLLQVTNHTLSSFATRSRHDELLEATERFIAAIPPCQNLAAAVARHATFARALMIRRIDTRVAWWTGSDHFRGQEPPSRLLAWPELRNVKVERTAVNLVDMALGVPVDTQRYLGALGAWLTTSPLTDLSTAYRLTPVFLWTPHTLSLVSTIAGSNLALRALSESTDDKPKAAKAAVAAFFKAAAAVPEGPARRIAEGFGRWIAEAESHWSEAV